MINSHIVYSNIWSPYLVKVRMSVAILSHISGNVRKLEQTDQYERYDEIIREQLQLWIIEAAPEKATGKEFYIPHKGVTRNDVESTKLRIVYDASARESNSHPSLNDCLHPGPPLRNHLWDVLVKSRTYPILVTADLKKAFLQIRIMEEERD